MLNRSVLTAIVFLFAAAAALSAFGSDAAERITPEELKLRLTAGEALIILDVRTRGSYNTSQWRIKGDVRIPPDELRFRSEELRKDREIITYCT